MTRPDTAGSLPSGSKVAEIRQMTKTVDRPNFGNASKAISDSIQASIGGHYPSAPAGRADAAPMTPPDSGNRPEAAAILLPPF